MKTHDFCKKNLLSFIILMAVLFSFSCANTNAINKDASSSDSEQKIVAPETPKPDMYLASKSASSHDAREVVLHEKELNIPEDNFNEESREEKAGAEAGAEVEDGLFADVFFDTDKSDIKPEYYGRLDRQAKYLIDNVKVTRLVLEGHCDERASITYNYHLGNRRALAVLKYLVDKGVDKSIIKTISFGKTEPFDVEKSLRAYAKNRRTHFVLNPKK
jgi:peptidoglycan-associated lipoprotein